MNQPQTEYKLEKTVAGEVSPKEPVVLQDTKGNKLRAPWTPNKKCKRCFGKGYVGKDAFSGELIPCRKCYPWNK